MFIYFQYLNIFKYLNIFNLHKTIIKEHCIKLLLMTTDTGQLQKINYNNKMTKKYIFHRLIKL